jgi:hypothetical protein
VTHTLRKLALTAHVTFSVGWLGAVVAYLMLAVAATASGDAQTVTSAWVAMELIGWYAIVPLALAALLVGLINALGTSWGLFRHYWILVKLLLTVFATTVLLSHMPSVSVAAEAAKAGARSASGLGGELLHAGGGLLVLIAATVLSVYKPSGLTPYGWRLQHWKRDRSANE